MQLFTSRDEVCGQWAALAEEDHGHMLEDLLAFAARGRPNCSEVSEVHTQDAMLHFLGHFAERLTPHPEVILRTTDMKLRTTRTQLKLLPGM